ncbi:lactate utilization protein C [Bacillus safensis]|uniref:LutC/YkgG family protein n=1 Tax=Bacillus safensis TaxID=561879 RepID=UPI002238DCD5|nr:lactate utilization protein C [Bacillus safensis]MCW4644114.1 lactate utilization protein C [Bacillus safensis]MCY7565855.1 lactate utilization protein C [Bacillus safensis]MCY7623702.1 lactate utilization protein C [Bacillus safensis]MCY7634458.1 lactate utilization protein C [Bacillus safensis]MCY7649764.1 lactate utilization protein C [Bacillus safensis]
MKGTISHRESFLSHIQHQLGKNSCPSASIQRPAWKHQVQWETNGSLSKDELVEQLKKQCQQIHTRVVETTPEEAPSVLRLLITEYGEGAVMTSRDRRFEQYGFLPMFDSLQQEGISITSWNTDASREEKLRQAEQAKYAVVFSDYTLAESGTVVLSSHQGQGRALHFLPMMYIVCIEKNSIVPRMIQAVSDLNRSVEEGEQAKGAIHFISGPSNSADIEMNLVVGVHGPVQAVYLLIDDE